ncbi:MAG: FMN-binding glutamate synthase family protein [Proteobacteria bacterium]|nr:FMN-binding glutamate synthase family protein [Pseudomonadota bacterium]
MINWPKRNDALGTVNRGDPCESGLCTLCDSACKGKCETWLASLRGREIIYPRDFGRITSGAHNISSVGLGYHALRIQGYPYGAHGIKEGESLDPDNCKFPNVNVETSFGKEIKVKCRLPIMTGALGSTKIAEKYWDGFAVGAALCGFPIVVGENVVGVDRKSKIENGRIKSSPELERRIDLFLRYYDGYGAIFVQMNVEDTRNGVAEYLIEKYGDKVILELKWGQGAKDIGGEIQVKSIDYAKFLKNRGYIVDPDPDSAETQAAYELGALKSFARHSRLGATDLSSPAEVQESFMSSVEYFRKLGFKRISLKTGAYGNEGLAMALRYSADANLDLLTIDGAGGGTGMSPWNMMQQWGVPSLTLHAKTYEYCKILKDQGVDVPDISLAGGFAREDHIFKAMALSSPFAKLVCMGRAPMIPGYIGANITGALDHEIREQVNGCWDKLPPAAMEYGAKPKEILIGWSDVEKKVGKDEMKKIPLGAVAMWNYADKLTCGLQQFMAGARKFNLSELDRSDLMAANKETAEETGITYMSEAQDESAQSILKQ